MWNNAERAQELGKEKCQLEDVVLTLQKIDAQSRDLKDLFELAEAEDDDYTFEAVEADLVELQVLDRTRSSSSAAC